MHQFAYMCKLAYYANFLFQAIFYYSFHMHWQKKENKILLVKLTNCEFYHDETVSQMHSAAKNPFLCRFGLDIFDEPLDRWISWYSGSVKQKKEMSKPRWSLMIFIWAISWDYGTFRPPQTHSSNAHAQPSSGARCLIFGRTLHLLPYFMCANSEDSGETARMRRLAWAFAGRLCDKYHNLMSWLLYFFFLPS